MKCLADMNLALERSLENGVSFNFELPEKGLSLRSVSVVDGVPCFSFDASDSSDLTTITEDDVATVARLVAEKKRPYFFYIAIPPNHPFSGRQYKQYSPQWLRGLSVGELLSEVDWKMKCLTIGAKTNDAKTVFEAASNTSKLVGRLGTCMDFPSEGGGSVKMSCKSVKVERSNDDMIFIGEPKMQIVSDASPAYTKYVTEVLDSVAFYDEPMFLRMQELTKLILAVEFLNERGVRFDRDWFMEKTARKSRSVSQAIEVVTPEVDYSKIIDRLPPDCSELIQVSQITKSGIKFHNKDDPESTIAVSVNDYDMLYDGFDPKQPIAIDRDDNLIIPDVNTWSELHKETVPWPRVWNLHNNGKGTSIRTAGGGVTTRHIPTSYVPSGTSPMCTTQVDKGVKREGQYDNHNGLLNVSSSTERSSSKKPPSDMIPEKKVPQLPKRKVGPTREVTKRGHQAKYGYRDEDGMQVCDKDGRKVCQIESTKIVAKGKDDNGVVLKRFSIDSGVDTMSLATSSTVTMDDDISETSDDSRLTILDARGTIPRYEFVSPIGSGDEMD